MKKRHFIKGYEFPEDGSVHFVTLCGIDSKKHKTFIKCTINQGDVDCIICNRLLNQSYIKKKTVLKNQFVPQRYAVI